MQIWMLILRVPIYIFDILRHHALMIYAKFLWRTQCPTENGLKAWCNVLRVAVMASLMAATPSAVRRLSEHEVCLQMAFVP